MKTSIALLCALALFLAVKRSTLVDTTQTLFFPKDVYQKVNVFTSFQLGSWSNIIVRDESAALKLCQELRANPHISKALCLPNLNDFKTLVKSWLDDQFYNYQAPTPMEFESLSDSELAKLTLLMGPEGQSLLEFIRMDPLNHKEDLLEKIKSNLGSNFVWRQGLLRHHKTPAILIPVEFNYKAEEIEKTAEIEKIITKYNGVMVGAHQGHLSNQGTIVDDLNNVGIIGTVVTILGLLLIAYFRLFKLAKLILPNALGICLSILVTWLVFGSVHAITITFGTGIIGLALDFGLHAIFLEDKKKVWHSNLYGLLTTLVVFIIFIFSVIPLIRQMMFFSTVALLASYLFTYLLIGKDYIPLSHNIIIKKSRWHLLSLGLSLIGLFHLSTFKIDTSIQRFNYTPKKIEQTQNWFYSQMKDELVYFKIYKTNESKKIEADYQSTKDSGIRSESIYSFIPSNDRQIGNVESWLQFRQMAKTTPDKEKIFSPFLQRLTQLGPDDHIDLTRPPEYLKHLIHNGLVLNMWFTTNPAQEKLLASKVQGAESLVGIILGFTKSMTHEIFYFLPISFLLIFFLLYFKYSSVFKCLICLIPFLFALGLYGLLYRYFHFPMSFMTLLGLFLIYGLSVDYGIFSTDLFTENNKSQKTESSFNIGLILTWTTNFLGFLPLLWCHHPILKDLGLVLVVGMIGVFYGTFFVIPAVFLKKGES